MLISPKDVIFWMCISMAVTGMGMGVVDGVVASLLGDVSDEHFQGTGKVFTTGRRRIYISEAM